MTTGKKTLVTGAAGFLGSHLVPRLLSLGHDVTAMEVIPKDSAAKLSGVSDRIKYMWKSVVDATSEDFTGYDYLVHLAAQADVPLSISSPRWTFFQNLDSDIALLEAARKVSNLSKILYMSTENVYGDIPPDRLPARESEPFHPSNVYSASKAAGELLINAYARQWNLPVVVLRSTTLFGENSRMKQAIPIFIRQALKSEPVTVEGDGAQTRDFNYVGNMVEGIVTALNSDYRQGVWNIGSGREVSINELAKMIIKLTNSESKVVNTQWRPGEKGLRLSVSIEKAEKELGYKPKWSLEEGLKRTIAWLSRASISSL